MSKWTDDATRRIQERCRGYQPAMSGGHFNPARFDKMLDDEPELWLRIGNRKLLRVTEFGRRPRPEPRTIPWAVALPLFVYFWWIGEL